MDEHSREAVIALPARAAPGSPQTPSCVLMRGARAAVSAGYETWPGSAGYEPVKLKRGGLRVSLRETPEGGAVRSRRGRGVLFEFGPQRAGAAKPGAAGHLRNR
jgi:hypothetical protein